MLNFAIPGVTRLLHFVKSKNLTFSTEEVKRACADCRICAELKPKFYSRNNSHLIKSTRPMERISIDFKGPLPSSSRNKYFLTIIDEYSCFPFVIPCPDTSANSATKALDVVFSLCGMPEFIHSDRGSAFMSAELTNYLTTRGIATSRSTPYHPIGNGQVERYSGIVWKSVRIALASTQLPVEQWEKVLPDVLHSIRSLLSTATNTTPHEKFFNFPRKSSHGTSLLSWLSPGPVLLRKFVRPNKNDDLVEEVELTHANPRYAHIRYNDGRESSVSLAELAPCPRHSPGTENIETSNENNDLKVADSLNNKEEFIGSTAEVPHAANKKAIGEPKSVPAEQVRRSTRERKKPVMYGFEDDA